MAAAASILGPTHCETRIDRIAIQQGSAALHADERENARCIEQGGEDGGTARTATVRRLWSNSRVEAHRANSTTTSPTIAV